MPRRVRGASSVASKSGLPFRDTDIPTVNVGIADWGGAFGDATLTAAMLDRLPHRAAVAGTERPSCRPRGHQNQADAMRKGVNARVS